MNALGRHVLAELYGCRRDVLNDVKKVQELMVAAAIKAGAEIREVAFHKFSPQGVSGVVVISESHLAVHTWPEYGYAAVDVFTCGERVDPRTAADYLVEGFSAASFTTQEIQRGVFDTESQAAASD